MADNTYGLVEIETDGCRNNDKCNSEAIPKKSSNLAELISTIRV